MTSDRLEAVERLLQEVMRLAPSDRASFVANISDTGIRDEVATLLAADADPASGIGALVREAPARTVQPPADPILGHFPIQRPLGHAPIGESSLPTSCGIKRKI